MVEDLRLGKAMKLGKAQNNSYSMSAPALNILFVCHGNICRSPMAEAVFVHTIKTRGLEECFGTIDSAGTSGYHKGNDPDSRSVETCRSHGIPVEHSARKVREEDFHHFDYILCMDTSNLDTLKERRPQTSKAVVQLFGEFDPQGERIIEDPYYGGLQGFEHNFQQVSRASEGLLHHLGLV
ncbi:phosphotyrosine protein phosphatase I superfamily [Endogone sp. FLAS-F59071]|nr:phosphotyrosine protein phosphatase I superfamily [Endogone sp. FLAS-F59071]|eukprot:RUS22258.1 phosphotyrosine protein phosphatase I superfamily [Endogone sp. FLAS-F59071]